MSNSQYKQLKKLINKLEEGALDEGVDITSPEFQLIIEKILRSKGFTLEEYELIEKELEENKKTTTDELLILELAKLKGLKGEKGEKGDFIQGERGDSPTEKELLVLIEPLIPKAKEGKEGPEGIRGPEGKRGKSAIIIKAKDGKDGEDGKTPTEEEIEKVVKKQVESQVGSPLFEDKMLNMTVKQQERIIEPLRRLAMGLQGQIDSLNAKAVDNETPSGTVNGSNDTFTLANTPSPATSLQFFINGQMMSTAGEDYTLSGNTITTVTAPPTNSILRAWYRK